MATTFQGAPVDKKPAANSRLFTGLVYGTQFFFGGWFLAHGLNYWLGFFPQPHGSSSTSRELILALISSGLFDIVKAVEVVTGVLLLLNLFVPLAIVLAVPVALSIVHLNVLENDDPFSKGTGIVILLLLGLMAAGRLDRYLPMLAMRCGDPSLSGLRSLFGRHQN